MSTASNGGFLPPWTGEHRLGERRLPGVIGHRGAAGHAPENTLASLRLARELGAQWVEIDVKLTADGRAVLLHDDRLDRTTDGHGTVADVDSVYLHRLDAGAWFGARHAGERVPTFEEAIACALDADLGLDVEIKPNPGQDEATAQVVVGVLAEHWPAGRPGLLLSSFSGRALAACRDRADHLPRGLLCEAVPDDWRQRMTELRCATLHPGQTHLDEATVKSLKAEAVPLLTYTVNDAARAKTLLAWGIDGIITDYPDRISALARGGGRAQ